MSAQILDRACTCGHAEDRHQLDTYCSACSQPVDGDGHCETTGCLCKDYVPRCQNCGDARVFHRDGYDVCSRKCLLQIEYAKELIAA